MICWRSHPNLEDRVNALAHLASTKRPGQHRTFIQETLTYLTTDVTEVCSSQIAPNGWKSPIWAYLVNKALPQEEVEAKKIKLQASLYVVINNEMLSMRTTQSMSWTRCIGEFFGMYTRGRNMQRELYKPKAKSSSSSSLWTTSSSGSKKNHW